MNDIDLDEVRSWAREAGDIARRHFNQGTGWRKADRSWVTDADMAIERLLADHIAARYPQHGIIAEELTHYGTDREFVWAIDPLDGTASYVAGLATWCVSLGLLRAGVPYLGVIYLPILDDYYWAEPASGAFRNGQAIHVAAPRDWDGEDWIATPSNTHRRFELDFIGKARSLGSVAAEFCYVARGGALGALLSRAALWDIAAGLALLRAAGGIAAGLSGTPLDTSVMLDGRLLPEPIIIGERSHVERLRPVIRDRRSQQS